MGKKIFRDSGTGFVKRSRKQLIVNDDEYAMSILNKKYASNQLMRLAFVVIAVDGFRYK